MMEAVYLLMFMVGVALMPIVYFTAGVVFEMWADMIRDLRCRLLLLWQRFDSKEAQRGDDQE